MFFGKQIVPKANANRLDTGFMQKHKITVNQPTKSHFSVEGVQFFTLQEIAALKRRQERLKIKSLKEGEFVKIQAYKIDDDIQYLERPATANDETKQTIKPKKSKKAQLQEAKPQKSQQIKEKTSIRKQIGQAKQKLVKRQKEQKKKDQYQKRLQDLKQEYKKHFGDEIKAKNKIKKSEQVILQQAANEQQAQNKQQEANENIQANEFQADQQEGDQCLPKPQFHKDKSIRTNAKTLKNKDDSFQQVQWQQKAQSSSIRSSRVNASTYSQKLGNAVLSLFD